MMSPKQRQDIAVDYLAALALPLTESGEERGPKALQCLMRMATPMVGSRAEESFCAELARVLEWSFDITHEDAVEFAQLAYWDIIAGFRPQEVMTS